MATVQQKAHLTRLCFHESKSIVTVQISYWLEYRNWRSPTNLFPKNIINDIWGTEPFLVVQFEPQSQSISLRRFETLPAELHKAYPTPMVHGWQVEKGMPIARSRWFSFLQQRNPSWRNGWINVTS
ncbi:hypothetical protein AVEN_270629-1 [Araneus ventricosus]|uniref:Uncharacterized protein n=1 Tax=Araneus ventricosus TaxID=182803 RepID=A0A4Y2R9B6_ARAVE|nr:hypothetical protein AVEN_114923-1 [Araneus ventricosus]GBN72050.1 hypothetical protein AVEN_270629-1 [Araneus ventricosus]